MTCSADHDNTANAHGNHRNQIPLIMLALKDLILLSPPLRFKSISYTLLFSHQTS